MFQHLFKRLLPFIIAIFIAFLLWRTLVSRSTHNTSPLVDKPVPIFSLPMLNEVNRFTSQADLQGHVSLVNIWASWCEACAEEHALLMQLYKEGAVYIYGINYKDEPNNASRWLAQSGNPYAIVAVDQYGDTAINWGVYGTPESFIVDQQGIVRYHWIGPITDAIWESEMKPLIDQLQSPTDESQ